MAVYFQLSRMGSPQTAVPFAWIDRELCEHFDVPEDPEHYLAGWYDYIGFKLALGKTYDQIERDTMQLVRDDMHKDDKEWLRLSLMLLAINQYLRDRYVPTNWFGR